MIEPIRIGASDIRRVFVVLILVFFVGLTLGAIALSRELYPNQYAQLDPALRQWFRNQTSPKNGGNCCSEADGAYVEEDIRGGHYFARWEKSVAMSPETQGWIEVPDDVVINDPNRNGAPVVWWMIQSDRLAIRCYAPGGKA